MDVDREAGKRRVLLARVRDEKAYHERMVGELSEAAKRLENFVATCRRSSAAIAEDPAPKPAASSRRASASAPCAASCRGRRTQDRRRVRRAGAPAVRTRTFHNGVDIQAAQGTEVGAVHPGTVV